MIRAASAGEFTAFGDDPFITRIRSLGECYGEGFDFVSLWAQELDGDIVAAVSRFEDKFSLYLTGRSDLTELGAFLSYMGAGSMMFDSSYDLKLPRDPFTDSDHLTDLPSISGEVLEYTGEDHISELEICTPEPKELYELLKTCESDTFRVPEYLLFLSDVVHRGNVGRLTASAVSVGGVIASSVMTVSETSGAVILGAVATRPDYRRRGLSRELVRSVATRLRADGRRVYVLSATESNTLFYKNSGFSIVAGFKEIFTA